MTRQSALVAVAVLLGAACALHLPPVFVEGTPADIKPLVGTWFGEYVSDATRKAGGSITFTLAGTDDVAYGDVLMTRRGRAFERFDPDRPAWQATHPPQSLTILIVRARDGVLTGELDPYWDFDLECRAVTVFSGRFHGDTISGTYETTYRGPYATQTGTWLVRRARTETRAVAGR